VRGVGWLTTADGDDGAESGAVTRLGAAFIVGATIGPARLGASGTPSAAVGSGSTTSGGPAGTGDVRLAR
jgi:hypothetical protein